MRDARLSDSPRSNSPRWRFGLVCILPLVLASAACAWDEPAGTAGMSNREVAQLAEDEFQAGARLRQTASKARPHFARSAQLYEELRRRGASNTTLYLSLGNACVLADDLPRGILAYHRGLQLDPGHRELRGCLAEARERVVYPSGALGRPLADHRPPWLPRIGTDWLVLGAFVLFVLACLALTRWLMTRRGRLLTMGLLALTAAGVLGFFVIREARSEAEDAARPLVVINDDGVLLRRGNGLDYPPRYETPVNRGVEARLLFERGDWAQIQLTGGEIGWVPRALVLIDTE
jgi:hypothetical protein